MGGRYQQLTVKRVRAGSADLKGEDHAHMCDAHHRKRFGQVSVSFPPVRQQGSAEPTVSLLALARRDKLPSGDAKTMGPPWALAGLDQFPKLF